MFVPKIGHPASRLLLTFTLAALMGHPVLGKRSPPVLVPIWQGEAALP